MVVLNNQSLQDILKSDTDIAVPPHTRLLCTLGPASCEVDTLVELMLIGMKVARIDLSWATAEWCKRVMNNVRLAEEKSGCICAIAVDTAGPELTVLNLPKAPVAFKAGSAVTITSNTATPFSSEHIAVDYSFEVGLRGLHAGSVITLDRYLATGDDACSLTLVVEKVSEHDVVCKAQNDCAFSAEDLLHVHIANMQNELPILGEADRATLLAIGPICPDFLMLSCTRSEQDILDARTFLNENGMDGVRIIAKIENQEGVVNHIEIIEASEAIIISRGSLGIDLPAEKVFLAQKLLIKTANMAGKTVIVTRVVDTMMHAPRPTRAEATDVANLVLDGVDGILLGLETFGGVDPANASRTVLAICKQAERCFDHMEFYSNLMDTLGGFQYANLTKSEALASSAVRATQKLNAKLIIAFTITGRTPQLISKYRANVPIIAVIAAADTSAAAMARCALTARQTLILRGVIPIIADASAVVQEGRLGTDGSLTDWAVDKAMDLNLVVLGDRIIVSQCPRILEGKFSEAGVVKFCVVGDHTEDAVPNPAGSAGNSLQLQHFGSICDIPGMT